MSRYCLRYKKSGEAAEFESFSDRDASFALILAQRHEEPAELWKDDVYLTTLHRSAEFGFWRLHRDQDVPTDVPTGGEAVPAPGAKPSLVG